MSLGNDLTKALHARRRAEGLCIYDARDRGRPEHGPPVKGGRCTDCWERKRDSQRRARAEGRPG